MKTTAPAVFFNHQHFPLNGRYGAPPCEMQAAKNFAFNRNDHSLKPSGSSVSEPAITALITQHNGGEDEHGD